MAIEVEVEAGKCFGRKVSFAEVLAFSDEFAIGGRTEEAKGDRVAVGKPCAHIAILEQSFIILGGCECQFLDARDGQFDFVKARFQCDFASTDVDNLA